MNTPSRAQRARIRTASLGLASLAAGLGAALLPADAQACACGCGVFDVGTSAMYASHAGGMVYVEYDAMDQDQNRSGTSAAPADNNEDKRIRTGFYTLGGQYFFNRKWGVSVDLPYWSRDFTTTDPDTGDIVSYSHGAAGDARLRVTYTGLSDDMSIGLTAGLKLANGDSSYADFDADTEIGSGSTDLLLGAYKLGRLTADQRWSWTAQVQVDAPVAHKSNYKPGAEAVVALGAYYEGWQLGEGAKLSPVAQLRAVHRLEDGGPDGHPEDTGYTRLLASPGLELSAGNWRFYADVALPLYTNVRGNQLVASRLWKLNVAYHF